MRTQLRIPILGTGKYVFTVERQQASGDWERMAKIPLLLS
jgi:hypothetical protein